MQIKPITYTQLTEVRPHEFVTEASGLGILPGQWPTQLSVAKDVGNGHPLLRMAPEYNSDNELVAVTYRQVWGCVQLRIFND